MKRLYKPIVLLLLIAILAVSLLNYPLMKTLPWNKSTGNSSAGSPTIRPDYQKGMYSWEDAPYLPDSKAQLYATLEALNINELYQSISDADLYSSDIKALSAELHAMNIDLYYLTGAPEWGLDPAGKKLCEAIDKVVAYNKIEPENGFRGIVFDVEPYGDSAAWRDDPKAVMDVFPVAMTTAYNYAAKKGLRIILCIPNSYDAKYKDSLESLIAGACDEVAVMNYNRSEEIACMETEVALAKQYKKPISCIFEFQAPGFHELTENETYHTAGLETALQNFEILREHFGYEQTNFAYHYYKPIHALLTE